MAQTSSDPRNFFETDAEQATRARRAAKSSNRFGNPIALKSKVLAVVLDPKSPSHVFVAESAGAVRRVNVDEPESPSTSYRGPDAPVTCVAIGVDRETIFAGCWDKTIWSWDIKTKAPRNKFIGHADFVKSVVCTKIGGKDILISGGADQKIVVWDVTTGKRLHTLQDKLQNMLAIQDLALDPVESSPDQAVVLSASSDPHIRRWNVRLDGWEQVTNLADDASSEEEQRTILVHETTVYRLIFDHQGDEVDLWTSSGDGTSKSVARTKNFTHVEETLKHGDHVRAIVVSDSWVITAGRDEDIKFWDRSSGELFASIVGHFDEVTDLTILAATSKRGERLCSVSIDGTIRLWELGRNEIAALVEEQRKDPAEDHEEETEKTENLMTLDEEAELAALMEED